MKEYAFVDMHIHTEHSDEELCDMSIEELLERSQKQAEKLGGDCVISIADHNTILGVKKARQILKEQGKEKYPNVNLINGIEFTTDLCELADYFDGKKMFTRCHILAFGYNENDKELTAYSKITHMHFSKNDNIGMQICAARRVLCENLNVDIPFSILEPLTEEKEYSPFKTKFIAFVFDYLNQIGVKTSKEQINTLVSSKISNGMSFIRESESGGRLKISEVSKLIKNAGGELTIAHPALIRVTVDGLKYIAEKNGKQMSDVYTTKTTKYKNNTNISFVKDKKFILEEFLNACESVTHNKIGGIETYYEEHYYSRFYKKIEAICKERGMFSTAGSDFHGLHLHTSKSLGFVFNYDLTKAYKQINDYQTNDRCVLYMCGISGADYFMNNRKLDLTKSPIIKNADGKMIPTQEFDDLIEPMYEIAKHHNVPTKNSKPQKQKPERFYEIQGGEEELLKQDGEIDFASRISELVRISSKFDHILAEQESPRKQAKLLLRLNLFTENIIKGMLEIKRRSLSNDYIRTLDDYKTLYNVLSDINTKYGKMLVQNPKIVKDLRKDMAFYYKKNQNFIHLLTSLHLGEPLKTKQTKEEDNDLTKNNEDLQK